jgi:hypothetical protein
MRRVATVALLLAALVAIGACSGGDDDGDAAPGPYPLDDVIRMNEIQTLSTHNSYHLLPPPVFLNDGVEYEHVPLTEQLDDQGVRGFEIDFFDTGTELRVEHYPVIDTNTTCTPLVVCLQEVEDWSNAHPGHVPLFVMLEPKVQSVRLEPELPEAYDAAAIERIDAAVTSVFDPEDLVTPDDVRGDAPSLRDAVTEDGWPTLGETRGKVVLVLNTGDPVRSLYLDGRPSLEGAPMFVTVEEDSPAAAVLKEDEPRVRLIQRLVEAGFIVRTRTDADTAEARSGDTRRRDAALRSGAQIISTDYPVPETRFGTGFVVTIPAGTPARCDPVNAPPDCTSQDVENPAEL